MSGTDRHTYLLECIARAIDGLSEPFLVPDATQALTGVIGIRMHHSTVFHLLRDMVDDGKLRHDGEGYRRV